MVFSSLLLGFGTKIITGLDDTLTHVPLLSAVAKTRTGQLAFSLGTLCAIGVAVTIAAFFASLIVQWPNYHIIAATMLFILAVIVSFNLFLVRPPKERVKQTVLRFEKIAPQRFLALWGVGFSISIATVADDIIAFMPFFNAAHLSTSFIIIGIILASIAEIIIVMYAAQLIMRINHKEKIASGGLLVLGILILSGVI